MTDLSPRDDIKQGRRKYKLSQKQLGELVGCHPQTIDKIERGQIKWSRHMAAIEAKLGLSIAPGIEPKAIAQTAHDVRVVNQSVQEHARAAFDQWAKQQQSPSHIAMPYGRLDLPLLRSEATSLRASEMFITAKPIQMTYRPSGLDNVDDAYALRVGSDCMAPAFEIGDKLFVDPTLPPEPGKDVLLRGSLTEDSQAVIGRLETYSDKDWTVMQWNSESKPGGSRKHAFRREEFPFCHRVVGKWSR